MFVLHKALNSRHLAMSFFRRGKERKRHRLEEKETQAGTEMAITAYRILPAPVTSFKYLGGVLSAADDDLTLVVHNLWRSQYKWEHMYMLLSRKGVDALTLVRIYVTVFQKVMLYGLGTWVMTPRIGRV